LLGFFSGLWAFVALSVVLGSLTIGSSMALMGTSAWLISTAALHPSIAALNVAIVGVRFFGIARAIFRYFERLVSHSSTFRILRNIRVWFWERLEPLAPARLMDFRGGDVLARATADVETLEQFYVRVLAPPLTALCVAAGTCVFLLLSGASQVALLAASLFLAVGLVFPAIVQVIARRPGSRMVTGRAVLHSSMVDDIQGMPDIVAFGRAWDRIRQLRAHGAAYARAQRTIARLGGMQAGVTSAVVNSSLWITLLVAIPQVGAGTTNGVMLASLALMVLASFEAVSPLPQAGQLWPAIREAAARLFAMVDEPAASGTPPSRVQVVADPAGAQRTADMLNRVGACDLEFIDVAFRYPGRARPALRNISFRLAAGGSLGIVGPSGAGKSSIANLLLRFWERDAGEIRIGSMSLECFAPEQIREKIGYVSQRPYLFDTTVYENLRLARRGVTRKQVEQAAIRAEIHDCIKSLPQGYDTMIGEHGLRLSAGERQRLAIARVLIKDAPLLVLDEPTANLDAVSEANILSTLLSIMRSKTTLRITHRLIGMEQLDEILVMDNGAVVERGSHGSLLAQHGAYARLWTPEEGEGRGILEPLASSP
jgi:ATP-binding cassette subfamily C protein CydC